MTGYDDIIDIEYPFLSKHPKMSRENRAAQFAPFAALTGHDDAISETARLTENEIELDEERKEQLNRELMKIKSALCEQPLIRVTYFEPDEKKNGGQYRRYEGRVQKIDELNEYMLMMEKIRIQIPSIVEIESEFSEEIS